MAPAVEEVADVVETVGEETLEAAETIRRITGHDMGLVFFGSCVGTIGGLFIGAWWMKKQLESKVDEVLNEERDLLRNYYEQKVAALEEREEKKSIDTVVKDLGYDSKTDGAPVPYHRVGSDDKPVVEDPRPEASTTVNNVFINPVEDVPTPEWDYAEEVKSRADKSTFVIHRDEYMENAWEFDKVSLTYFEGDDVLSNERDEVILAQDETVGFDNLGKFGHGSNDPDVVYICNKEKAVLIEVTHSDGRFSTEVHGFTEDELQHSSVRRRPSRRSRYDDSD